MQISNKLAKKRVQAYMGKGFTSNCTMTKRNLTTKTKRYCIIDMKGREHPEHVLRQWSLDGFVGIAGAGGEF